MTHPPGIWKLDPNNLRDILDENEELIATVYGMDSDLDTQDPELTARANAQLIAAAPELLSSLKESFGHKRSGA